MSLQLKNNDFHVMWPRNEMRTSSVYRLLKNWKTFLPVPNWPNYTAPNIPHKQKPPLVHWKDRFVCGRGLFFNGESICSFRRPIANKTDTKDNYDYFPNPRNICERRTSLYESPLELIKKSLHLPDKFFTVWMVTGLAGVIRDAIKRTRYCRTVDWITSPE